MDRIERMEIDLEVKDKVLLTLGTLLVFCGRTTNPSSLMSFIMADAAN